MYCRNYTGTVSRVLYREVCYTVSLFGRFHYQRFTVCLLPIRVSVTCIHTVLLCAYVHTVLLMCVSCYRCATVI